MFVLPITGTSTDLQSGREVSHLGVALADPAIGHGAADDIVERLRERQLLSVL